MTTFPSPEPIDVTLDLLGDARISAGDRTDTVVVVRPADPAKAADVRTAEDTTVDFDGARLVVKTPKTWRRLTPFNNDGRIDLVIEVPTGSRVTADTAVGHLTTDGELGACRLKTAMGTVRVDQTGPLQATSGFGDLFIERVRGDAEVKTGSGAIHVGTVDGSAVVRNANGHTTIDHVGSDLRVRAANGDITVGRARASVTAKSANGDVRIGEVRQGAVVAQTAAGEVAVGVHPDTAVWLELDTRFGRVHNDLATGATPSSSEASVTVRASTSVGDILIHGSTLATGDTAVGPDGSSVPPS